MREKNDLRDGHPVLTPWTVTMTVAGSGSGVHVISDHPYDGFLCLGCKIEIPIR
jgi:hypothetical protein